MSDTNPFAYTEESPLPRDYSSQHQGQHAQFSIYLKHKTGTFSSRPCVMRVTENQAEILGEHLPDPILIDKDEATKQIKLRLLDMIVRNEEGRKYRMIYSKSDTDRALSLARLDAWLRPELTQTPEETYQYLLKRLTHWTCGLVKNWLLCLSVLQFLVLVFLVVLYIVSPPVNAPEGMNLILIFVLAWVVFLIATNLLWLTLLRFGKVGALYGVIGVYMLFCLVALVEMNIVGIVIGAALVSMAFRANSDFRRLKPQISVSLDDI